MRHSKPAASTVLGTLCALSFTLILTSPGAASAAALAGKPPALSAPPSLLEVGRTQEIKLDEQALLRLQAGQKLTLDLRGIGTLPLVFEHATPQHNNTTFWEAHIDGDPTQRISLRRSASGLSGSVVLKNRRYWISQTGGKTFVTRMSDAYEPPQRHAGGQQLFATPTEDALQPDTPAERPEDLPDIGTYPVTLNMKPLRDLPLNTEVALNLPDGRTVSLVHDNASISPSGNYTFVGYVRDRGTDYRVVITTGAQGESFGVINLPEGEIRVETRKGRTWLVDTAKAGLTYAPMAEPLIPAEAAMAAFKADASTNSPPIPAKGAATAAAPGSTTVDLMVVYTPGMVSRLGGDAQVRTRIDNLVAVTNQIMVDSQVQVQMRLVKALYVNQSDNVNQGDLLKAINSGQGAFSNIKAERDAAGADLVHLLHKPTVGVGSCGIAYLSVTSGPRGSQGAGYGVTDDSCPTMVMAHELGHNFGMNHDHAQGGSQPVYPYAWGYIVPGTNLGDVMSYARQHYYKYANPRIGGCASQACGRENYADAAQAINQTSGIVAGYRGSAAGLPNGRYRIVAAHSSKCIGITGASTADGAGATQAACNSGTAQSFDITRTGNGEYKLINVNSRKTLGVPNASNTNGTALTQSQDSGVAAQRFGIQQDASGGYTLVNRASGQCVDIAGASTADGAVVIQWPCHGRANQSFRLTP